MKYHRGVRWSLLTAMAALSCAYCMPVNAEIASRAGALDLREFKRAIEVAIQDAKQVADRPPYFIIQKIELKLQVEARQGASGSLSFAIPVFGTGVDLGAEGSHSTLQKLEVELVPPENMIVGGSNLIDLAPLIRALKATFQSDAQGRDVFNAGSIKYSVRWALVLGAEGKARMVIATAGVKIGAERTQEATFTLCQTKNMSDCIR